MNTKDNQRSRLTKLLMKQAFLDLMHKTAPDKITVKEICSTAELNRTTFYLHYSEPNDILIELEDEAIKQVSDALCSIGHSGAGKTDTMANLFEFLRYIRKNDDLFRTFLVENSNPHFRRKLQKCAKETVMKWFDVQLAQEYKEYAYTYLISGCIDLLIEWIRSNYQMSDECLGDILFCMCEGGLRSICLKLG